MIQCDMGSIPKRESYWWHTNSRFVARINASAAKCYSRLLHRTAQFSAGMLCSTIWYTEEPKFALHLYCIVRNTPQTVTCLCKQDHACRCYF